MAVADIGRLENEGAAPGIDLVARSGVALGVELSEVLPAIDPPGPAEVLRGQARELFDRLMQSAERETLQLLVPFLTRLAGESATTNRSPPHHLPLSRFIFLATIGAHHS